MKKFNDKCIEHIFDGDDDEKSVSFQSNDYFYKLLIDQEEEYLFAQIKNIILNNQLVTIEIIQKYALK